MSRQCEHKKAVKIGEKVGPVVPDDPAVEGWLCYTTLSFCPRCEVLLTWVAVRANDGQEYITALTVLGVGS